MARKTSYIGIGYEDVGKVLRNFQKTRQYVDKLQKLFINTLGKEGEEGGAFTKKSAHAFKEHLISKILDQSAFSIKPWVAEKLSKETKTIKGWLGLGYHSEADIGYATGAMVNAIQALDQGYGTFRVGIPQNAKKSASDLERETKSGQKWKTGIEDIAVYAHWLEHGNPNNDQPPRPFMGPTFYEWVENNLPEEVSRNIHEQLSSILDDLAKQMNSDIVVNFGEEDYSRYAEDPAELLERKEEALKQEDPEEAFRDYVPDFVKDTGESTKADMFSSGQTIVKGRKGIGAKRKGKKKDWSLPSGYTKLEVRDPQYQKSWGTWKAYIDHLDEQTKKWVVKEVYWDENSGLYKEYEDWITSFGAGGFDVD